MQHTTNLKYKNIKEVYILHRIAFVSPKDFMLIVQLEMNTFGA